MTLDAAVVAARGRAIVHVVASEVAVLLAYATALGEVVTVEIAVSFVAPEVAGVAVGALAGLAAIAAMFIIAGGHADRQR